MKKVVSLMCIALIVCTLAGCDTKKEDVKKEEKKEQSEKIKGKCHAVECIKQINVESKLEDINQIIGFDGITKDGKENTYYWEIAKDETIKVVFGSNEKATITAEIERSTIADKKVDFSKYDELQKIVKSGITYDTFKTYVGNVDGVITEKSSISTKYTWVAKSGEYLNASFSNSTNQCRFVIGRVKEKK